MERKRRIKIALGELGIGRGNQEVFERISDRIAEKAAQSGAKLLCLPELSSCGYFIRREELLAASLTAEEQAEKMAMTAKKYGISLIFGYPERNGETIYNSCLVIDSCGRKIQNIRKVNLWKSEKKRFSEGRDFPVFETCAGQTAAVLCYDLEFPEPARIVSMKGARLLFCPAAWSFAAERRWEVDLASAALCNLAFTAGANYRDENCCGGSCVYGPDGRQRSPEKEIPIELPGAGESRLLVFELDLDETDREREKVPYYEDWKGELYGNLMKEAWEKRKQRDSI